MSIIELFHNVYTDLSAIIAKAKSTFCCNDFVFEIKLVANNNEDDVLIDSAIHATIHAGDFMDWETLAVWFDEQEDGLNIEVYTDGLKVIKKL